MLPSGYAPTAVEQVFLERLNDARANPAAYGQSIGLNLASVPAAQPLAFNTELIQSSRDHSQDMNTHNYFGHYGSDGSDPFQRMQADGFPWVGAAESIAAGDPTPEYALAALIIDAGVADLGHRKQLLSIGGEPYQGEQQTGVGIVLNGSGTYSNYYTIDSGYTSDTRPFLLGVAYNDLNLNGRYDAGEGLGNVTIIANGSGGHYQTTTWGSGGYSIQVNAGTYTVTAEGGGMPVPVTRVVTLGPSNYRLNFQPPKGLTTTALSANANPGYAGETITFTATVTNVGNGSGVPQGQVEFFDGTTDLGPGTPLSGSGSQATSTFTTAELPAGTHALKAVFSPLGIYHPSQGMLTETITVDHLVFTVLPGTGVAGQALNPSVQVQVVDPSGNLVTTDNSDQITVVVATGPGPIAGGSTTTETASGGIATFDNIVLTTAGSYTFNAVGTGGLTGPVSGSVFVSPGMPAQLAFVLPAGDEAAGAAIDPPMQVQILDQFGNLATQDNSDQVSVAVSGGPGMLSSGSTATATASGGVAVFDGLTFTAAGTYVLGASAAGLTGAQSGSVVVPLFADTFDRPDSATLGAPWVQVAGSVGVFSDQLTVTGFPAGMAVYGSEPLSDSEVQATISLSAVGVQSVGLVARYSGPGKENFYLGVLGSNRGKYTANLLRNVNGQWKQLATAPVSGGSGILTFQVVGRSLKLFLDGQLLVYSYDSALSRGTTGVWGSPGATVTDFAGGPMTAAPATLPFNDSFASPSGSQLDAFWSELRGNFSVQGNQLQAHATGLNLALISQATTASIAATGTASSPNSLSSVNGLSQASDVVVSADIALAAGQAAGLMARYKGPLNQNYYFGQLAPAASGFQATIWKNVGGIVTRLVTGKTVSSATGTLEFEAVGSSLKLIFKNGPTNQLLAFGYDGSLKTGSVGIRLSTNATADNFNAVVGSQAASLPFTDNFSSTGDASQLSNSWTDRRGNITVVNGQATGTVSGTNIATVNGINASNVSVSASIALTSGQTIALMGRYNAATDNYYFAQLASTASGFQATIWKRVNGVTTVLKTGMTVGSATGTLTFTISGSTLDLSLGSTTLASVTDSSLTNSGSVGMRLSLGTALHDFSAS